MRICVRGGHNYNIKGAIDIIDEVIEDRKIYKSVIKYLKIDGHTVYDGTPERTTTKSEDLAYGVNIANKNNVDLFVSIHLNASKHTTNAVGCEVIHHQTSTTGRSYAVRIEQNISKLGFKSRGSKADIRGLYELNHTKMPAIIVESFFVDSVADVDLYNKVGIDRLGKAIAEGIVGHEIKEPTKFPLPLKMLYDCPAFKLNGKSIDMIKYFYRKDFITARAEFDDKYVVNINGVDAYVFKNVTTAR